MYFSLVCSRMSSAMLRDLNDGKQPELEVPPEPGVNPSMLPSPGQCVPPGGRVLV